jgi:hydrogenase maturation protein HypF
MWWHLCRDLRDGVSPQDIARRFHSGLAQAIADMAATLAFGIEGRGCDTVALSGGCFQNRYLAEEIVRCLQIKGLRVLMHGQVPANDGGLALGQAAIAVARLMRA